MEDNSVTTADLAAAVLRRRYLTMAYLTDLVRPIGHGPALHVGLHNFTTLLPEWVGMIARSWGDFLLLGSSRRFPHLGPSLPHRRPLRATAW